MEPLRKIYFVQLLVCGLFLLFIYVFIFILVVIFFLFLRWLPAYSAPASGSSFLSLVSSLLSYYKGKGEIIQRKKNQEIHHAKMLII